MFMTKRRHEAETESLRDEISRLRGARMMDAETIRQQDARHKVAVKDLEKQAVEIEALRGANQSLALANRLLESEAVSLRPDAFAMRRKRARDRDQKALARKGRGQ